MHEAWWKVAVDWWQLTGGSWLEPMTGIEPAYSAWEVDLTCSGLLSVVHRAG